MTTLLEIPGGMRRPRLFSDIVRAIGLIVDLDEGVSVAHQWRTAVIAHRIATKLPGVCPSRVFHAALVHDVGSVGMQTHVVHAARTGFADDASRQHPAAGARVLEPFSMFRDLAPLVANHHERYDGNGFPDRKRGSAIPIGASVIAIADAIDVLLCTVPPQSRAATWSTLCNDEANGLVPIVVADAALVVLDEIEPHLPALFDHERIGRIVEAEIECSSDADDLDSSKVLPEALWLLARLLDIKHPGTMAHSTRVTFLAYHITRALDPTINMWDVLWVGLLHDIGKVGLSRRSLDSGESHEAAAATDTHHAKLTLAILSLVRDLQHLALPAAAHHENVDGSGPLGLLGEAIPLLSRIVGIADQYDVLTALQSPACSHKEAVSILRSRTEGGADAHLVEAALSVLDDFGQGIQDAPETMGKLYRFFDFDVVDIRTLVSQQLGSASKRPAVNGVLLYETEPWKLAELDTDFNITRGQQGIVELTGSDYGPRFSSYLSAEDREQFLPQLAMTRIGLPATQYVFTVHGRPLETIIVRRDWGYEVFLRSAANRIQTLDRMAYFYRNFLSSTEAAFFTDAAGCIVDVNRTLLTMYGLKLRDAVGGTPRQLLGSSSIPTTDQTAATTPTAQSWAGRVATTRSDGTMLPVHLSIKQVRDVNGTAIGSIGHVVDLTEQQRLQDELEQKNIELESKNRELEQLNIKNRELMAITSHDLKAPLNAMIAYAELLGDSDTELAPKDRHTFLHRISAAGHKLVGFINSMLDIEKIEAGTFGMDRVQARLDLVLASILEDQRIYAATKSIEIEFSAAGSGRQCLIDPVRLEQVCSNLLANAVKFSPPRSVVSVAYRETGGTALVEISDEGPGVPAAETETIFERFHQTQRTSGTGAGLGLAIAQHIVEQHGGRIWVENLPQRGAKFSVEIPALPPTANDRTRAEVIVVDVPQGALADVADQLRLRRIRTLSIESCGELELVVDTEHPRLVLANEAGLSRKQSDLLSTWRSRVDAPRFVHIGGELASHIHPFDETLTPPLLDRELSSVLRTVGLNATSRSKPT